jgi:hypothetical protein
LSASAKTLGQYAVVFLLIVISVVDDYFINRMAGFVIIKIYRFDEFSH